MIDHNDDIVGQAIPQQRDGAHVLGIAFAGCEPPSEEVKASIRGGVVELIRKNYLLISKPELAELRLKAEENASLREKLVALQQGYDDYQDRIDKFETEVVNVPHDIYLKAKRYDAIRKFEISVGYAKNDAEFDAHADIIIQEQANATPKETPSSQGSPDQSHP